MIFNIVILCVLAAVIIAITTKLVAGYKAATGTIWERVFSGAHDSATMLWGYITTAGGLGLVWADRAAQFFNLTEVQAFLSQHLSATSVGIAFTIIAVITIIARTRSLFSA